MVDMGTLNLRKTVTWYSRRKTSSVRGRRETWTWYSRRKTSTVRGRPETCVVVLRP